MLFNSHEFIFLFLPAVLVMYFTLNRSKYFIAARAWLVFASLFFYAYFNPAYLILILLSITVNFTIGRFLEREARVAWRKLTLLAGLIFNLGMLGHYKYHDFFVENLNALAGTDFVLHHLLLPLGISFFTFQQLSYIVDIYKRGKTPRYTPLTYSLFVSFFPQLIAGPIVLHHEMMPQFEDPERQKPDFLNLSAGMHLFVMGLFKKVVLADTFSTWAATGFDGAATLTFWQGWVVSIAYTFQLYFDFSGYCDMATGIGRMFNIHLPINFNSPYLSTTIKEFWTRWHMTLGRFLSHYVYYPLGGNRQGRLKTYRNLMITFFLSGLWHGAGWTFIIFGLLHGIASVAHRIWNLMGRRMHHLVAGTLTFLVVNIGWVFFRARSVNDALKVLRGMFLSSDFSFAAVGNLLPEDIDMTDVVIWFIIAAAIVFFSRNAVRRSHTFVPTRANALATVALFTTALLYMSRVSEFIYYNF
jgi:alginate O-acetyltransferase complex protein AlgI